MSLTSILSLFLLLAVSQATHHHHRHHEEEKQEMQAASDSDNPFAARPEGGMYDMRGDHFAILDTPEKMDPDYQAKQELAMVNKANHLRGSQDDDDDDE